MFAEKATLERWLGESLTTSEYLLVTDIRTNRPLIPRAEALTLLAIYRRGYEDGYQEGRFAAEGEPS